MIDLHSHILPAIDDGAPSVDTALEMARIAVADGITHLACTPHIVPGLYDNDAAGIEAATASLADALDHAGIGLVLFAGADIHVTPELRSRLDAGTSPTIAGTRYFLFEPPHHVLPPGIAQLARDVMDAGYVPVLTHPERLTWIENSYDTICQLDESGVAIQLTAGSVTGGFGSRAQYWSERMLAEGRVDIVASDAHDARRRPPVLSKARDRIAELLDDDAAWRMTRDNPATILNDLPLPAKRRVRATPQDRRGWSWFGKGARSPRRR
ncbi:MAG: CpsB/CapC family capsule biosynthesis tyrosine phosphatase [Pseudomonadota bacterium]|nr:CpsB/CapC family capsule biosynthesis tyrosine phosphatase [Pseudomonadota bacterium]